MAAAPGDADGSPPLQGPRVPSGQLCSPQTSFPVICVRVCVSPNSWHVLKSNSLHTLLVFWSFPRARHGAQRGGNFPGLPSSATHTPPGDLAPSGGDTHPRLIHTLRLQLPQGGPRRDGYDSAGEKDAPQEGFGSILGHRQLVGQSKAIWQCLSSGRQARVTAWLKQVGRQRGGAHGLEETLWEKGKNGVSGHSVLHTTQRESEMFWALCEAPWRCCDGPPRQKGP